MPGPAILQDTPVGWRGGMVRFVNDDGLEIRHEAGEPGATAERLHTGDHGGSGILVACRLHDAEGEGRIDEAQFVHGLLDELIAMRQDQGPAPTPLDEEGKHNGFARPGGQDEQRALHPARRGGEQGCYRLVLVRPGREPECGRRLDNSLHQAQSQRGGHKRTDAVPEGLLCGRTCQALFIVFPTSCTHSPCGRLDGSISPDLCWWLHDPWSSLAPNDLLSVVTAQGHAPDPAGALGACEARAGPPLLIIGSRCEPVPPNEWSIPA